MHGEQVWGLPVVEKQAHVFAAAFLMPRADIYDRLPTRADWPALFELKRRWQVSLAALLMRARTLERMSESNYVAAVKTASARGWRRVEPVPLGDPEKPRMLGELLASNEVAVARNFLPPHAMELLAKAAV
jgi:Zn-dependent peptidase ImmA (M78 family)